MSSVKTYLYISDAKINMFYEQLASSDVHKIGAEYGVDVKLFKWVGHRETETLITQQAKLQRVLEFLRTSKEVGIPSHPLRYFSGALTMSWGVPVGNSPLTAVIFTSVTANDVILLAGSISHIVGHPKVFTEFLSPSYLAGLYEVFRDNIDSSSLNAPVQDANQQLFWEVVALARKFNGVRQNVEFVAKTHMYGTFEGGSSSMNVLIGSPIYVAEA